MSVDLGNLYKKRDAESRSLTAENIRGEKGKGGMATMETSLHKGSSNAGRELGQVWKLSPCIPLPAGQTAVLMDNEGPSFIRHIWMTLDWKMHYICDPIYFKKDLKVQMQCLGWRSEGRYLPLQDDVASVAYWYQTLPHVPFPAFPNRDVREII